MPNNLEDMMFCEICKKHIELDDANFVVLHLKKIHFTTSKEYYDSFFKKQDEGICKVCKKETKFLSIKRGYRKYCSNKCISKDNDLKVQKLNTWNNNPNKEEIIRSRAKKFREFPLEKKREIKTNRDNTLRIRYGSSDAFKIGSKQFKESLIKKYGRDNLYQYGTKEFEELIAPRRKEINEKALKKKNFLNYPNLLEQLKEREIDILSTREEFTNNKTCKFFCNKCKTEFSSDYKNQFQVYCHNCEKNSEKQSSLVEKSLLKELQNSCDLIIEHRNKKLIHPYELDIYFPEKNVAVELDGTYWHSDIFKDKNYHLLKTNICHDKGIQLIHVFDFEYIHKKDIILSMILSKLGVFKRIIYARDTEFKEIYSKEYNSFIKENHIQGSVQSKYKFGLFYNDELVSVCGFSSSRFKKGEVELTRFCSLLNTKIIGGFSKLVKNAEKYLKEKSIDQYVSYCNLRFSRGDVYSKNGFTLVNQSPPSYSYVNFKKKKVYSRFQCRKSNLKNILDKFDESLTEYDNMLMNKFYRIYDCGNLKFKKDI